LKICLDPQNKISDKIEDLSLTCGSCEEWLIVIPFFKVDTLMKICLDPQNKISDKIEDFSLKCGSCEEWLIVIPFFKVDTLMKFAMIYKTKYPTRLRKNRTRVIRQKHELGFKFDMRILWRMTHIDSFFLSEHFVENLLGSTKQNIRRDWWRIALDWFDKNTN